jgi:TetR/AcrR family transcriptional repressor of nem operon
MNENIQFPKRRGRPPRQTRETLADTRALLIQSGTAALTEYGFTATGIDGILKLVGVPKGSFYYYFDSKEVFGLAVLDNYRRYFAHKLEKTLQDTSKPPLQRLQGFVDDAKVGMTKYHFRRGCLIGNLNQEICGLPESFHALLLDTLDEWQQYLAVCFSEAQQAGELSLQADCQALARFFWIGWEGAVMRARLTKNCEPLDLFLTMFMAQLPR